MSTYRSIGDNARKAYLNAFYFWDFQCVHCIFGLTQNKALKRTIILGVKQTYRISLARALEGLKIGLNGAHFFLLAPQKTFNPKQLFFIKFPMQCEVISSSKPDLKPSRCKFFALFWLFCCPSD